MKCAPVMRVGCGFVLAAWLCSAPAVTRAQQPDRLAIQAAYWIDSHGAIQPDATLLIENGHISTIGAAVPENVPLHSYPHAVVCPGLVDCRSALGVLQHLSERDEAINPRIHAADAFNQYSAELAAALRAGVTTFALMPDDENLVGGRLAICRTASPPDTPQIIKSDGPFKLSLSPTAFKIDRPPTARIEALSMLRSALREASRTPANSDPLALLTNGNTPAFLATPFAADVLSAVELAREFNLRLILLHNQDAHLVANGLTEHILGVVLDPLPWSATHRQARAAALFANADVPVAFAGGLPFEPPDSLRISAAVAVRAGLPLPAARQSITTNPARLLGVADQTGEIATGRSADLVIFTGDPLDLRSRVLAVYVAGQRLHRANPSTSDHGG